jgi:peptidyl-prolyl cis-trans isomerase B (cyclophilin B)
VTSTRERQQRAAARARLAREMAERQAAAKRRRQRMLAIGGAIGLLLVAGGTYLVVNAVTGDESTPAAAATATPTPGAEAAPGPCAWNEAPPGDFVADTGVPSSGEPREGTQTMTVTTNFGDIVVNMDLAAAPCIAASFSHLAGQQLYDGVYCHRMFPGMLQCGDPNARDADYIEQEGIGQGGPAYQYADENLPTTAGGMAAGQPYYPAGTMAMANSGPGTNGSQFFFIYQDMDLDGPNYSVVGQITEGLEVLQEIDAIGNDGAFDQAGGAGGGHPNEDVIIESLTVSEPEAAAPASAAPTATPTSG